MTQQGLESAQRVCGCVQARCAQAFCSAGGVEACRGGKACGDSSGPRREEGCAWRARAEWRG